MPVFLAGRAVTEGSQPHVLWCGVGCRAGEQRDATSRLPLPRQPLAVGAHAGPCHPTSQLTPTPCGSTAQEGIPQSSSFYPDQVFPKQ